MLYINTLFNLLENIIFIIPVLLVVAFVTVAERKTMASMQRRLGPNIVGYYGLLQAFADALKLLLKEYISPTQANIILFFLGPVITLIFSLLGYAVIPYAPGLTIFDLNIGILYMLAVSSLATYGILLAGWSANSKYAFLGSLRSTAQLISYELILSSGIFLVVLITSSLNLTVNVELQKCVWLIAPLFPIAIVFFIAAIAETNRAPFDLAEAESELVSGFMTEHSSVVFVFFFLAEYASIILICIFMSILFLGGYYVDYSYLINITDIITAIYCEILMYLYPFGVTMHYVEDMFDVIYETSTFFKTLEAQDIRPLSNSILEGIIFSSVLAIKSFILVFSFIWVRASLPRIRYDQLMIYCWTIMLPIAFAIIVMIPCLIYVMKMTTSNFLFF